MLRDNGSDIGGGHRGFINKDGTAGVDENLKPLTEDQLALARKYREKHPNVTPVEKYEAGVESYGKEVVQGAEIAHYREALATLEKSSKPAEGDPNYAPRMEAYNKQWAKLLKALPEEDRAHVFKENKDAEAVYAQYKDDVTPMRLNDNVPAAAADQPAVAEAADPAVKLGLTTAFKQCVAGAVSSGGTGEACSVVITDQDVAATDKGPKDQFNSAADLLAGKAPAIIAQPVSTESDFAAYAAIKAPKAIQTAM
jgi:ribosomal protein L11 methylase PrmA